MKKLKTHKTTTLAKFTEHSLPEIVYIETTYTNKILKPLFESKQDK